MVAYVVDALQKRVLPQGIGIARITGIFQLFVERSRLQGIGEAAVIKGWLPHLLLPWGRKID